MTLDLHRVRGALLCSAVGDALGRPVKAIDATRRLHFKYGKEAPTRLAYSGAPPARITDETQQVLFVADGLIRHKLHETDRTTSVIHALRNWRRTQHGPGLAHNDGWLAADKRLYFRRLPERTTELALDEDRPTERPTLATPVNTSAGPTAMTRSLPYGVVSESVEDAFQSAFEDAAWTHGDPIAQLAAGYYAAVMYSILRGTPLGQSIQSASIPLLSAEGLNGPIGRSIDAAKHIAAGGPPSAHHLEAMGDARHADAALAIGLCCTMSVEDGTAYGFVRALWRAVAHGGSSDTTGAITGALLGGLLGMDVVPHPWLIDLEMLDILEKTAKDLFATATGREVNADDYPRLR
jgi:ADP-ribosylglycohydrolase